MIRLLGIITGIALFTFLYLGWQQPEKAKDIIAESSQQLQQQVDNLAELNQQAQSTQPEDKGNTAESPLLTTFNNQLSINNPVVQNSPYPEKDNALQITNTYKVWQAFSSKQSAQGFKNYLQQQTGIPLAVEQTDQNFYVVLNYQSEEQRQQAISQINQLLGIQNKE